MKTIILTLLLILTLPIFGQKTITDKAIFNYTPLDKVWFSQRIDHYNDTTYIMEVSLDSKILNESNTVVLHFADGDCIILDPIVTIDKDKYVITYFYSGQFKMSEFLINKCQTTVLVGYSINYQYKKVSNADGLKYLRAFKKICK